MLFKGCLPHQHSAVRFQTNVVFLTACSNFSCLGPSSGALKEWPNFRHMIFVGVHESLKWQNQQKSGSGVKGAFHFHLVETYGVYLRFFVGFGDDYDHHLHPAHLGPFHVCNLPIPDHMFGQACIR